MDDLNVICVKWGDKYPPEYVNRLYSMVQRRLHRPHRFVCLTDDATGLHKGIEPKPLPFPDLTHAWAKLNLYADPLHDLSGTGLYFDVDVVIVDDIDPLIDHQPEKPIMSIIDWQRPYTFNSSVLRYKIGHWAHVGEDFGHLRDTGVLRLSMNRRRRRGNRTPAYIDTRPREFPADYRRPGYYPGEQQWTTDNTVGSGPHRRHSFPNKWIVSYKMNCQRRYLPRWFRGESRPPADGRVVVFHGKPNPHEVKDRWVDEHWR